MFLIVPVASAGVIDLATAAVSVALPACLHTSSAPELVPAAVLLAARVARHVAAQTPCVRSELAKLGQALLALQASTSSVFVRWHAAGAAAAITSSAGLSESLALPAQCDIVLQDIADRSEMASRVAARAATQQEHGSVALAMAADQQAAEPADVALAQCADGVQVAKLHAKLAQAAAAAPRVPPAGRSSTSTDPSRVLRALCAPPQAPAALRDSTDAKTRADPDWTPTTTAMQNLGRFAVAASRAAPLLVTGPPGAGKTALVRHAAAMVGADLVELHLDASADAKSLIGTYTVGDMPGEFVWAPGAVTQAARAGAWLLVEDADRAPLDVLAAIAPLAMTGQLTVPGRTAAIEAAQGFRFIATCSMSSASSALAGPLAAVASGWGRAWVVPLPHEELEAVFQDWKLPSAVSAKILQSFEMLQGPSADVSAALMRRSGRHATARDLFKWAHRAVQRVAQLPAAGRAEPAYLTTSLRTQLVADAWDCFLGHVPDSLWADALALLGELASIWGIDTQEVQQALTVERPALAVTTAQQVGPACITAVRFGRASLPLVAPKPILTQAGASAADLFASNFVLTGHAARTIERVAAAVQDHEPLLLCGETGNGKTAVVQALASALGQKLVVQNMHVQSDAADLMGGWQPASMRAAAAPIQDTLLDLFPKTFSQDANAAWLVAIQGAFNSGNWAKFCKGAAAAAKGAIAKLQAGRESAAAQTAGPVAGQKRAASAGLGSGSPVLGAEEQQLLAGWTRLRDDAARLRRQHAQAAGGMAFQFAEGALVRAVRDGHWMLLDEVNLASADTLQRLAGLLEGGPLVLSERGDVTAIPRHENFRLFAAMNPGNDAGKKELPPALRQRFTEIWVPEVTGPDDLRAVVQAALSMIYTPEAPHGKADNLVEFHLRARELAATVLTDGVNNRPRFSLRTLGRALKFATHMAGTGLAAARALYEGVCMAYLTPLHADCAGTLNAEIKKLVLKGEELSEKKLAKPPKLPGGRAATAVRAIPSGGLEALGWKPALRDEPEECAWTEVESFWLQVGPVSPHDPAQKPDPDMWASLAPALPPVLAPAAGEKRPHGARGAASAPAAAPQLLPTRAASFVVTPSVRRNLRALSRAVAGGKYPALLQGPTSAGKTSLVEYLAARTGHVVVRLNNHEHTDVAEYLGAYAPGPSGSLEWRDGLLVAAARAGWWLILDELNLAPSEVLEALNRLLDDNRELFIPETQETVRPAPTFMLFATQNPAGTYGGRKQLSAALRNRFLELYIDELPAPELETMLVERGRLPSPFAKAMVSVSQELQRRRADSDVFAGRHGLVTPRDLLRWAARQPGTWESLAQHGYMLLAERLRTRAESEAVASTLAAKCKAAPDPELMYSITAAAAGQLSDEAAAAGQPSKRPRAGAGPAAASAGPSAGAAGPVPLHDPDAACYLPEAVAGTLAAMAERGNVPPHGEVPGTEGVGKVSWTKALARLVTLVGHCLARKEPVLLVGETGGGKTTVVQLFALLLGVPLTVVNAHAHSEVADFLGALRPLRGRTAAVRAFYASAASALAQCVPLAETAAGMRVDAEQVVHIDEGSAVPAAVWACVRAHAKRIPAEAMADVTAAWHAQAALFEWQDGPLVQGMREGHFFLLDEISLAEDAVLERLNSVLEPSRTVTLAERMSGDADAAVVQAAPRFRFFATMNPGGDFGKRELSPALRNRFTEIWVPPLKDPADLLLIIQEQLAAAALVAAKRVAGPGIPAPLQAALDGMPQLLAQPMLSFMQWIDTFAGSGRLVPAHGGAAAPCPSPDAARVVFLSLRDVRAWATFVAATMAGPGQLGPWAALVHGAALVLLDGLGAGVALDAQALAAIRSAAFEQLALAAPAEQRASLDAIAQLSMTGLVSPGSTPVAPDQADGRQALWGVPPFFIGSAEETGSAGSSKFAFGAPTTACNLLRVLRGLQVGKPVLLEGSPGVGKTTLVAAMADTTGHTLVRINLSEQTDVADLFGGDLPVPCEGGGTRFQWVDGVFLAALKAGHWVLLDELNLASQAVLEGLNAVLDHRGTVYLPELGRSFTAHPSFRVFAAQNPVGQGGGRKGLPASFLNRFTRVMLTELTRDDLRLIAHARYPGLNAPMCTPAGQETTVLDAMIEFNCAIAHQTMVAREWGRSGSPWEFNLRDLFRWADATLAYSAEPHPERTVGMLYVQRFRTAADQAAAAALFESIFSRPVLPANVSVPWDAQCPHVGGLLTAPAQDSDAVFVGRASLHSVPARANPLARLPGTLHAAAAACAWAIVQAQPVLLVGPPGAGKSAIVQWLADTAGREPVTLSLTVSTDASELLGCFEQHDVMRAVHRAHANVAQQVQRRLQSCSPAEAAQVWASALHVQAQIDAVQRLCDERSASAPVSEATDLLAAVRTACQALLADLPMASQQLDEVASAAQEALHVPAPGQAKPALRFEWVDGPLVTAVEQGRWLVIDGANFAPASVLDRLNSLLEPDGMLAIAEAGGDASGQGVRVVKPHPDFRLVLLMDERLGEVSRAMRNRCVELYTAPAQRVLPVLMPLPGAGSALSELVRLAMPSSSWLDQACVGVQQGAPCPSAAIAAAVVHALATTASRCVRLPAVHEQLAAHGASGAVSGVALQVPALRHLAFSLQLAARLWHGSPLPQTWAEAYAVAAQCVYAGAGVTALAALAALPAGKIDWAAAQHQAAEAEDALLEAACAVWQAVAANVSSLASLVHAVCEMSGLGSQPLLGSRALLPPLVLCSGARALYWAPVMDALLSLGSSARPGPQLYHALLAAPLQQGMDPAVLQVACALLHQQCGDQASLVLRSVLDEEQRAGAGPVPDGLVPRPSAAVMAQQPAQFQLWQARAVLYAEARSAMAAATALARSIELAAASRMACDVDEAGQWEVPRDASQAAQLASLLLQGAPGCSVWNAAACAAMAARFGSIDLELPRDQLAAAVGSPAVIGMGLWVHAVLQRAKTALQARESGLAELTGWVPIVRAAQALLAGLLACPAKFPWLSSEETMPDRDADSQQLQLLWRQALKCLLGQAQAGALHLPHDVVQLASLVSAQLAGHVLPAAAGALPPAEQLRAALRAAKPLLRAGQSTPLPVLQDGAASILAGLLDECARFALPVDHGLTFAGALQDMSFAAFASPDVAHSLVRALSALLQHAHAPGFDQSSQTLPAVQAVCAAARQVSAAATAALESSAGVISVTVKALHGEEAQVLGEDLDQQVKLLGVGPAAKQLAAQWGRLAGTSLLQAATLDATREAMLAFAVQLSACVQEQHSEAAAWHKLGHLLAALSTASSAVPITGAAAITLQAVLGVVARCAMPLRALVSVSLPRVAEAVEAAQLLATVWGRLQWYAWAAWHELAAQAWNMPRAGHAGDGGALPTALSPGWDEESPLQSDAWTQRQHGVSKSVPWPVQANHAIGALDMLADSPVRGLWNLLRVDSSTMLRALPGLAVAGTRKHARMDDVPDYARWVGLAVAGTMPLMYSAMRQSQLRAAVQANSHMAWLAREHPQQAVLRASAAQLTQVLAAVAHAQRLGDASQAAAALRLAGASLSGSASVPAAMADLVARCALHLPQWGAGHAEHAATQAVAFTRELLANAAPTSAQQLASAAMLALLQTALLLPVGGVDPVSKPVHKQALVATASRRLAAQSTASWWLQRCVAGTEYGTLQASDVQGQLAAPLHKCGWRAYQLVPASAVVQALALVLQAAGPAGAGRASGAMSFQQANSLITRVKDSLLNWHSVLDFVQGLVAASGTDLPAALARAQGWRTSMAAALRPLEACSAAMLLPDILQPVLASVRQAIAAVHALEGQALRAARPASVPRALGAGFLPSRTAAAVALTVRGLLALPGSAEFAQPLLHASSFNTVTDLQRARAAVPGTLSLALQRAQLLRVQLQVAAGTSGHRAEATLALVQCVRAMQALWVARQSANEAEEAAQAAKESLQNAVRQVHVETDDEAAEAAFKALFPDWHAEYADLREADVTASDAPSPATQPTAEALSSSKPAAPLPDDAVGAINLLSALFHSAEGVAVQASFYPAIGQSAAAVQGMLARLSPVESMDVLASAGSHASGSVIGTLLAAQGALQLVPGATGLGASAALPASVRSASPSTAWLWHEWAAACDDVFQADAAWVAFHRAPAVTESRMAVAPLLALQQRLCALLSEFPGHAVLSMLLRMVDRLLRQPLASPLGSVLTGVEVLLAKAQEWESVASKAVSLSEHLDSLSALVVRWRKQELRAWPSLLQLKEQQLAAETANWLWQVLSVVSTDALASLAGEAAKSAVPEPGQSADVQQRAERVAAECGAPAAALAWLMPNLSDAQKTQWGAVHAHTPPKQAGAGPLQDIGTVSVLQPAQRDATAAALQAAGAAFAELERFLRGAALGNFCARLALVRAVARLVQHEASQAQASPVVTQALQILAGLLGSTVAFYAQYVPRVEDARQRASAHLRKQLHDAVKLSRWDDRTYYSLKEYSQKSARTLGKLVADYEVVLRTPAAHVLDADPDAAAGILSTLPSQLAAHLLADDDAAVDQAQLAAQFVRAAAAAQHVSSDDEQQLNALCEALPEDQQLQHVSKAAARHKRALKNLCAEGAGPCSSDAVQLRLDLLADVERIADDVVQQAAALRADDAPKPRKTRALVALLAHLKSWGLRPHEAATPAAAKSTQVSLLVPMLPASAVQALHAASSAIAAQGAGDCLLWQHLARSCVRADGYHWRNLDAMHRLRLAALSPHEDVSATHMKAAVNYAQHAHYLTMMARTALAAALPRAHALLQVVDAWHVLSSDERVLCSDDVQPKCAGLCAATSRAVLAVSTAAQWAGTVAATLDSNQSSYWASATAGLQAANAQLSECQASLAGHLERCAAPVLSAQAVQPMLDAAHAGAEAVAKAQQALGAVRAGEEGAGGVPAVLAVLAGEHGQQARMPVDALVDVLATVAAEYAALVADLQVMLQLEHSTQLPAPAAAAADAAMKQAMLAMQVLIKQAAVSGDGLDLRTAIVQVSALGCSGHFAEAVRIGKASALAMAGPGSPQRAALAKAVLGVLQPVLAGTLQRVLELSELSSAVGKLVYVLARTFRSLAKDGFCMPPPVDEEESGDGDAGGTFEASEGTGLGEGEGAQDVSEQIENEGQLGELAGQEPQDQPDVAEEENGIEMDGDMDGQLQDVERGDDAEDDASGDEQEEDLDREMTELNEGDEVDEDLWGSDDEEDEAQGDQQRDSGLDTRGDAGDDMQLQAAEEDVADEQQPADQQQQQQQQQEEAAMSEDEDEARGPEEDHDAQEREALEGAQDHEEAAESDMELDMDDGAMDDGDDAEEDMSDAGEHDADELVEEGSEDADQQDEQQQAQPGEDRLQLDEDDDASDGAGSDQDQPDAAGGAAEPVPADQVPGEDEEHDDEHADQDSDAEGSDAEPEKPVDDEEQPGETNEQTPAAAQAGEGQDRVRAQGQVHEDERAAEQQAGAPEQAAMDAPDAEDAEEQQLPQDEADAQQDAGGDEMDDAAGGAGGGDDGAWQLSTGPQQGGDAPAPKRLPEPPSAAEMEDAADMSQALRQWQARLHELASQLNAEQDAGADSRDGDQPDEQAGSGFQGDMLATESGGQSMLAPKQPQDAEEAGAESDAEHGEVEDHEEDAYAAPADDVEEDMSEGEDDAGAQGAEAGPPELDSGEASDSEAQEISAMKPASLAAQGALAAPDQDLHESSGEDGETASVASSEGEDWLQQAEAEANTSGDARAAADAAIAVGTLAAASADARAAAPEVVAPTSEELQEALLAALASWDTGEHAVRGSAARRAWSALTASTSEAASRLCEALRLVLEPTLASKLAGDYRTGKRLNMRRIIPYIASNFRKDKIWLRRTKPSQRTYQVLLAVDDSASMQDSGAAMLAVKSLSLVSSALTKLEVGNVGVMSFGEQPALLHDLNAPFSPEAGARVLSQFTFAQRNTDTGAALKSMVSVLESAASSARMAASASLTGSSVQQLVFLLSDGIVAQGNQDVLRQWVIEIAARGALLVCVLLDTGDARSSVLSTEKVTFEGGKVVRKAYLDDFPFPYYIIVRDAAALPDLMGDALRQWIAAISAADVASSHP